MPDLSRVFFDTSAALAFIVKEDSNHDRAVRDMGQLRAARARLLTTSYVLLETYALLTRRAGLDAVATFRSRIAPLITVTWVDSALHESGLDLLLERQSASLSLVDTVSFLVMWRGGLDTAFAYDRHFQDEGFAGIE